MGCIYPNPIVIYFLRACSIDKNFISRTVQKVSKGVIFFPIEAAYILSLFNKLPATVTALEASFT
jgi:ABC-type molybdate transport system permease subunit